MRVLIDAGAYSFNCSKVPEPVLDHQTRAQKADANGEPLFSIELVAYGEEGAQIFPVKVPGTPPAGIKQGMPLKVSGLVVSDWTMEGRHGLSFRAARVELVNGSLPKAAGA